MATYWHAKTLGQEWTPKLLVTKDGYNWLVSSRFPQKMGMSYCEDLIHAWGSPCSTELLLSILLRGKSRQRKTHQHDGLQKVDVLPKMVQFSSIYSALVYFARMFAGPTVILSKPLVDQ